MAGGAILLKAADRQCGLITEHFQRFPADLQESYWGDLYDRTKQAWKQLFEAVPKAMTAAKNTRVAVCGFAYALFVIVDALRHHPLKDGPH